ncbi:MAG: hypothetical protein D6781_08590 [Verrucomicrobia bacterium]|nr:MAG: hypothetical protein D6781_08590 [Verrucomicrobiota bacterium]
MDPRVYEEQMTPESRIRYRVENLGLDPDKFTVFLATGGAGANNHLALLPVLHELADTHQAVVVCGRNHKAFLQVNEWRRRHPELKCHLEGYCNHMHLLIQASDTIVTRGGTTTCAKALHFGCPIILNAFGGIMPQERLTAKFFLQDDAAVKISEADDLRVILRQWRDHPESFEQLRQRFLGLRYEEDPTLVIRDLINLAREAATASVKNESRDATVL